MSLSPDHLFHRMKVKCPFSAVTLKCPSWLLWVGVGRNATQLKGLEQTETAWKGQSAHPGTVGLRASPVRCQCQVPTPEKWGKCSLILFSPLMPGPEQMLNRVCSNKSGELLRPKRDPETGGWTGWVSSLPPRDKIGAEDNGPKEKRALRRSLLLGPPPPPQPPQGLPSSSSLCKPSPPLQGQCKDLILRQTFWTSPLEQQSLPFMPPHPDGEPPEMAILSRCSLTSQSPAGRRWPRDGSGQEGNGGKES